MNRWLFSGGILAGDLIAQAHAMASSPDGTWSTGMTIIGGVGLHLSLRHFAAAVLSEPADQPETFTV